VWPSDLSRSFLVMILPDGWETQAEPQQITAAAIPNYPWFAQLPAIQQGRLVALANAGELRSLTQALDLARNTVVAAVDGLAGASEGDFLAAAYRCRGNLSVYDLVLKINTVTTMLGVRQVPPGAVNLTKGSVTGFGHRVPQTELLIPHPGPEWAFDAGTGGLAACIESVLGPQSKAYVLTDNETPDKSQAAALVTNTQAVNDAHAQEYGYVALTWTVTPLSGYARDSVINDFGGVPMQIRHDPPYKLIVVQRP
jgi:hypothetical protein